MTETPKAASPRPGQTMPKPPITSSVKQATTPPLPSSAGSPASGTSSSPASDPGRPPTPAQPSSEVPLSPEEKSFISDLLKEVDTSLGITGPENFDLSTAQFWYQAAFKKDLDTLFGQQRRLKFLVAGLKARNFSEEDIYQVFARVRKHRAELLAEEREHQRRTALMKAKIVALCVFMLSLIGLGAFFSKKRAMETERYNAELAKAKTLRFLSPINIKRRGETDNSFNRLFASDPTIREKDTVYCSASNTLLIPQKGRIVFQTACILYVSAIRVKEPSFQITKVQLEIKEGNLSWKRPEGDTSVALGFTLPKGDFSVIWGEGNMQIGSSTQRIAVLEGENRFSQHLTPPVPVNGLMEVLFTPKSDKPTIQLMD